MRRAITRVSLVTSQQRPSALVRRVEQRRTHSGPSYHAAPSGSMLRYLAVGAAGALTLYLLKEASADEKKSAGSVDYAAVRKDIQALLDDPKYDDGSYGPVFIRLAWHASGTFDKVSHTGGSSGASMRYGPESAHGANAGLAIARDRLEKVKAKYPGLSYADLWTLAGCVAVESMGGPKIPWRPGRSDSAGPASSVPDGRLPDAGQGQDHIRTIFYRMGFNDQEIVALIGAHAVGRCHKDRSGFDGPWTNSPTVFSNDFFVQLLNSKWTERKWNGPKQYEDETKKLMMLPGDMAFVQDPEFKKYVVKYANDEALFFADFAKAFSKLMELGVDFPGDGKKDVAASSTKKDSDKPWWKFW